MVACPLRLHYYFKIFIFSDRTHNFSSTPETKLKRGGIQKNTEGVGWCPLSYKITFCIGNQIQASCFFFFKKCFFLENHSTRSANIILPREWGWGGAPSQRKSHFILEIKYYTTQPPTPTL